MAMTINQIDNHLRRNVECVPVPKTFETGEGLTAMIRDGGPAVFVKIIPQGGGVGGFRIEACEVGCDFGAWEGPAFSLKRLEPYLRAAVARARFRAQEERQAQLSA